MIAADKKTPGFSDRMRKEYLFRINRVLDYIDQHLAEPLTLAELARIATFSPFHFHRIFAAMMGETLNHYIQRLRIEKAAQLLAGHPKKSITEIAFDCGFSGSAPFARAFKESYGLSASAWRSECRSGSKIGKTGRKNDQTVRNGGKAVYTSSMYNDAITHQQIWRIQMQNETKLTAQVRVKEMPELTVAYVRHVGPYKGDTELFAGLYEKLFRWAGPRGLLARPDARVLSVYHDDPELTDESRLRTSVCIAVPEDTEVEGEIGKMTIPGGKYAMAHFEIDVDQFQDAWNAVCGGWLPESGYQPADGPCFEWCHNDPREHPQHKHIIDICIPVIPL